MSLSRNYFTELTNYYPNIQFEEFYGWYAKISGTATKGKMMSGMALKFAKAMRNYNGESVREEAKRLILATAEREQGERTS